MIEVYTAKVPDSPPASFLPAPDKLMAGHGETRGLPEDKYLAAWKQAASGEAVKRAQDTVMRDRSYVPAMQAADRYGLKAALARAAPYDSLVQLAGFFNVRVDALQRPTGADALFGLSQTTDRVEALRRLAAARDGPRYDHLGRDLLSKQAPDPRS